MNFTISQAAILIITLLICNPAFAKSLVIGYIAEDPSGELRRFQPVVDYLARNLREFGIDRGQVVIVRSIHELANLFKKNEVDLYMDSPFPSLVVSRLSDSKIFLRRWRAGVAEYHSVIFVREDSEITSAERLKGKLIGFEEPYSTSGYFLPKAYLLSLGFKLSPYQWGVTSAKPDEIGYVFTREDENTMEHVVRRKITAGAMDNVNFERRAGKLRDPLRILYRTVSVPRQMVSFRKDLDEKMVKKIRAILVGMEHSDEGREILKKFSRTTRFDDLPGGPEKALRPLTNLLKYFETELTPVR
jgi:phosphonate transport system substrate-binding protein